MLVAMTCICLSMGLVDTGGKIIVYFYFYFS